MPLLLPRFGPVSSPFGNAAQLWFDQQQVPLAVLEGVSIDDERHVKSQVRSIEMACAIHP